MKTLIATLALATASVAALAESPNASGPPDQQAGSALTRTAALQELSAARAAGTLLLPGELGQVPQPFVSRRSRQDVRAELADLRRGQPYRAGYQPA